MLVLQMDLDSWAIVDSGPGDFALNMALDEALLEAMPRLARPVLRFYGWLKPAASFGYFQRYTEVERLTPLRPLVRRPTAGGLVPHDADWTYSLVFPPNSAWYALTARASYRQVHQWIQAAFARLHFTTVLAPTHKEGAGQCFAGYEESDLLWHGNKIAGAAQRRRRDGLLIQGSVQPPAGALAGTDWQAAMREVAEREFGLHWEELELDSLVQDRAQSLAAQKYSQESYNRKR